MSDLYALGLPSEALCVANPDVQLNDFSAADPSFIDDRWLGWYRPLPQPLAQRAVDYLSHKITRYPNDLSSHLRRIVAEFYLNNAEGMYGAMLDLFIVLDKHGFRLRQRLLNKLSPFFKTEQRTALRKGLLFGIKSVEEVPHSYSSRFNRGLYGHTTLVMQVAEKSQIEFSVLDEARDLIDSGFFGEAMMILQEAISRQPDDVELNKELLDLFRYTRNNEAFFAARERFSMLSLALSDAWDELAELLSEEEGVEG